MSKKPEITWSLFHPVALDTEYMAQIISQAEKYKPDSFEICGQCHHPLGGLDGLILYEKYPEVNARLDKQAIEKNRATLKEILRMAHESERPVLYWHREIMVPSEIIKLVPGLLDRNGEFDLLGSDFEELIRYKIESAFAAIPELDGVVLTLTEADYSVIHNSTPDKYPPEKVVEKIVRIFASELQKRGKRFVLRSFGSIAKDYKDILDGAALAAKEFHFEIETKITPYDFVPFLPVNPFFRDIPGVKNSAELDSLGEFLGAGYLPAANVENIVRYAGEARAKGITRYAIRIDRIGNCIFNAHEINLFAYHRAIENPEITAEEIWKEWSGIRWQNCPEEMTALSKSGFELVKRTHYIDGNVIFHMFPLDGSMKWLKAGGIFALFKNGVKLEALSGIWSILSDKSTPGRDRIRKEKAEAVELAENGLKKIRELKDKLQEEEFLITEKAWKNAVVAANAVKAFCDCACSYFDDMEANKPDYPSLKQAVAAGKSICKKLLSNPAAGFAKKQSSDAIEHHAFSIVKDIDSVYTNPVMLLLDGLEEEYQAEFAAGKEFRDNMKTVDFAICGGITDEWRIGRYMHGSHSFLREGIPGRTVGNRVFPNGFIKIKLKGPGTIKVKGNKEASSGFKITVNGKETDCSYNKNGYATVETAGQEIEVKIEKSGTKYPEINAVAVEKS